jgi:photosystem II stability/assembly factor-like uncharacterized protein
MKNTLLLSLLFIFQIIQGQNRTDFIKKEPNYIHRQNDFYEKRAGFNQEINFSELFYKAYLEKEKLTKQPLHKKSNLWTPLGPFGNENLSGIGRVNEVIFDTKDTSIYYICVAQGGVWKTLNSGKSWINISGNLPILRTSALALHPNNSDTMYLATGDYAYLSHNLYANGSKRNSHYGLGIYKTFDGGKSWKPTGLSFSQTDFEASLIQRIVINKNNPNQLLAVGQTGAYLSSDAGNNWTKTNNGLFWDLEIDVKNPNRLYATTGYLSAYDMGEAGILFSNDFGLTWSESTVPFKKTKEVQRIKIAQAPSDQAILYAIACDAETNGLDDGFFGFYQSTDTGKTWKTKQDKNYKYNLLGWDFTNTPGGQGKYDLALVVDKNDKNKVSTGGVNIWTTTDGGSSFLPATYWALNYQNLSLHADVHSLRQHPDGRIFACHDGGLSATKNMVGDNPINLRNGTVISTDWQHFTAGLNITSFYRLGVNNNDESVLMAGAQDNSTSALTDNNWFNLSGGDGMECTFSDDNLIAYTSSQGGNINRFIYDEINKTFDYFDRLDIPANERGEWTTPFKSIDDKLYVGFGNLYTYESLITTGQKISNFPTIPKYGFPKLISALAISNNSDNKIYLAKRSYALDTIKGEIWTSENGANWKEISGDLPLENYPSYLYTMNKSTREVWVTFSGFVAGKKVFYSKDEGNTWKNISYNLPNIPVNCVAVQEDKTKHVYIGTDHGVYLLDTIKNEWMDYSEGLPNVIISELEIHPKSAKLFAATFGGGVWQVDLKSVDSNISVKNWITNTLKLSIDPNPAHQFLNVHAKGFPQGNYHLKIIDITGKIVFQKLIPIYSETFYEVIPAEKLNSGAYFISIEKDNRRVVEKFLKL